MVLAKSQHKGDGFTPSTNVNFLSFSHRLTHYLNGNWRGKRQSWWLKTVSILGQKLPLFLFHPSGFSSAFNLQDLPLWKCRLPDLGSQMKSTTCFVSQHFFVELSSVFCICFSAASGKFRHIGKAYGKLRYTLISPVSNFGATSYSPGSIFSDCIRLLGPIW